MNRLVLVFILMAGVASRLGAQSDPPNVPILSGAVAFLGTKNGGASSFTPIIAPVFVAPLGDHWLIEGRGELQGFIARDNGTKIGRAHV